MNFEDSIHKTKFVEKHKFFVKDLVLNIHWDFFMGTRVRVRARKLNRISVKNGSHCLF